MIYILRLLCILPLSSILEEHVKDFKCCWIKKAMEPSLTPCAIYIYSVELSHCRVLTFFTAEQLNYEKLPNQQSIPLWKKKERRKGQSKLSESKLLRETLRQLFINKLNYFHEICHKNSKQEWCYSERWLYDDNNSLPHSQFLLIFRLDKDLHALISLNWKQLMKYGRMCFLLFL